MENSWIPNRLRRMLEEKKSDDIYETDCYVDKECQDLDQFYVCKENPLSLASGKRCAHKGLFPLLPIEWLGTFLFSIIMLLSNVGGIGGGGIAIPMVQIFFGWDDLKKAIAISSF